MVHSDLPKAVQSRTVIYEFQAGIESELRHWELGYECILVDRLLDDSGSKRAAAWDDTLVGLQEGLARDRVLHVIQEHVQQPESENACRIRAQVVDVRHIGPPRAITHLPSIRT
jgi:hypothetical protein